MPALNSDTTMGRRLLLAYQKLAIMNDFLHGALSLICVSLNDSVSVQRRCSTLTVATQTRRSHAPARSSAHWVLHSTPCSINKSVRQTSMTAIVASTTTPMTSERSAVNTPVTSCSTTCQVASIAHFQRSQHAWTLPTKKNLNVDSSRMPENSISVVHGGSKPWCFKVNCLHTSIKGCRQRHACCHSYKRQATSDNSQQWVSSVWVVS